MRLQNREEMESPRKPLALDFFCGAGGFSLGFHQAGFCVIGAYDIDRLNTETYRSNFPSAKVLQQDILKLNREGVYRDFSLSCADEIDVVFGGPPCQGFSLIGKREDTDPRNQLLIHFAQLIAELQPRYFVIENVAGLMIGNARSVLAKALRIVKNAGYRWVSPIRILDAQEYGVPQNRKRVIVIGYRSASKSPNIQGRLGADQQSAMRLRICTNWDEARHYFSEIRSAEN